MRPSTARSSSCGYQLAQKHGTTTMAAACSSARSCCSALGSSAQGGLSQLSSPAQVCVNASTASAAGCG